MLTPDYLEHCADDVIDLYQRLDESIARDIARRLVKMGEITDTARWQAEQLQHAGLLFEDVIAEVAKYSGAAETSVRRAFEDAGVLSVDNEIVQYLHAGINVPPIRQSERAWNILQAALKKTNGELKNLTMTTAVEAQQRFIRVCTLAEMQVTGGFMDYQTAVRRAVANASAAGASVLYPSGHIDKLDVAVRRAVVTGVNRTCGRITDTLADEFGCDIMEITAHAGARPAHAAWQGKLVSRSGRRGYLSLFEIGYGSGAGFMGWNCRHNWNPFFPGISERAWDAASLKKLEEKRVTYNGEAYTDYEISQIQRRMERGVRATKRTLSSLDAGIKNAGGTLKNGLEADFSAASVKLKAEEAKLRDLRQQTAVRLDGSRVQVQGFGRSESQKAVWANKKELEKYSRIHYHKDGTIVVTDDWKDKGHKSMPQTYKPNAVIETTSNGDKQIDRTFFDSSGKMQKQVHSGAHGKPNQHPYGEHGEHCHLYTWMEGEKRPERVTGELTAQDKVENKDILGGDHK